MHILHVVGARPNFIKFAPVQHALSNEKSIRQTIVHTGQHYDANMSEIFFHQLGIPEPDLNLEVGSGTHAEQTATIMTRFEAVADQQAPDLVLVYGDVNSTVAAALVCAKQGISLGHVEAGLRSFDRSMPEEINRLVTDQLADLLFTPSRDGDENLTREGIDKEKIHFVGNVMIDTLVRLLPLAEERRTAARLGLDDNFGLVTIHRPSNVDDPRHLTEIMKTLGEISKELTLVFPIHPRTVRSLEGFAAPSSNLRLVEPLGYLEFLSLMRRATLIITDSGGIQEESTFLKIPCLTVRASTERPVTVTIGTNTLVGVDMHRLTREVDSILSGNTDNGDIPPLWDGHAAERIAACIVGL